MEEQTKLKTGKKEKSLGANRIFSIIYLEASNGQFTGEKIRKIKNL